MTGKWPKSWATTRWSVGCKSVRNRFASGGATSLHEYRIFETERFSKDLHSIAPPWLVTKRSPAGYGDPSTRGCVSTPALGRTFES